MTLDSKLKQSEVDAIKGALLLSYHDDELLVVDNPKTSIKDLEQAEYYQIIISKEASLFPRQIFTYCYDHVLWFNTVTYFQCEGGPLTALESIQDEILRKYSALECCPEFSLEHGIYGDFLLGATIDLGSEKLDQDLIANWFSLSNVRIHFWQQVINGYLHGHFSEQEIPLLFSSAPPSIGPKCSKEYIRDYRSGLLRG